MRRVTRDDLRAILRAWADGAMSPAEVHEWAENRYAVPDVEVEDELVNEVLGALDILDINLTTVEDVPVFLSMLALPLDRYEEALELLRRHGDSVDIAARIQRYRDDPFYGRFCK